jgi:hypothetical protein
MRSRIRISFAFFFSFLLLGITHSVAQDPVHVEIKNVDGKYGIYVDGKQFIAKGVGLEGGYYAELKEAGGNSFRTWRCKNADEELAAAAKHGYMVLVGLDIDKELHGFDFDDEAAVAEQFERIKKNVDKYKDHPNLLAWAAGNELNLLFDEKGGLKLVNPKTYTALAQIVDYIHEVDPHHPVTTTFAGVSKEHVEHALNGCPQLDFLSYQVYGGVGEIGDLVKKTGIDRPYMVTEFGPMGHWEMPSTSWGREIEEPGAVKARAFAERMEKGITNSTDGLLIGSYAFLWGQKQERTPTWYGFFHADGSHTARLDELTRLWTGKYPANRAPLVESISLDGKAATDNIHLKPGETYTATIEVTDPENDPLKTKWTVMNEVGEKSEGGAHEATPEEIEFTVSESSVNTITFVAPKKEGDYRLFAYVYDGNGKVGDANVPFFVKE